MRRIAMLLLCAVACAGLKVKLKGNLVRTGFNYRF